MWKINLWERFKNAIFRIKNIHKNEYIKIMMIIDIKFIIETNC